MELFRDSDSEGEEPSAELKINQSYATHYEEYRAAEELQRLKAKYGDVPLSQENGEAESSSSSESESDEAIEDDMDFFKTLSALKSKDPKIYDGETYFFGGEEKDEDEDDDDDDRDDEDGEDADDNDIDDGPGGDKKDKNEQKSRKIVPFPPPKKDKNDDKPMFLKDYERETVLAGGKFDEDEVDENDIDDDDDALLRPSSPTYVEEQRKIQQSFKEALGDDDEEEDDEDNDGDNDGEEKNDSLLKKKIETQEEKDKEEKDFREWLMKNDSEVEAAGEMKDLSGLKNYWNQSNLEDSEKFLKNFLLSKQYLVGDKDGGGDDDDEGGSDEGGGGMVSSSEEEEEMDKMDDFESQFNFRFQEPDADVLKSYPRTIEETVRKEVRSRKEKRDAREERKKEEKAKVIEELNLLKNLKQKEILSKVEQLKKIAGKEEGAGADKMDEEYFDKDFDPDEHDAMVAKMFDTDYYEGEGAAQDEKLPGPPPLPTEGLSDDVLDELAVDDENWDVWDGVKESEDIDDEEEAAADAISEFLQSERASKTTSRKEKRQRQREKKKSLFKKAVEKDKPVFDPGQKSFDEYIEEYYKLNFEDVIGKTPVRFKYRQVQANSFGLTMEEILGARDKELNQWASIKKASQYRTEEEELYDVKAFEAKAKNDFKKRQVLKSLFEVKEEEEEGKDAVGEIGESAGAETTTTTATTTTTTTTMVSTPVATTGGESSTTKGTKKKKKKKKTSISNDSVPSGVDSNVQSSPTTPAESATTPTLPADNSSSAAPTSAVSEAPTNSNAVSKKKKRKKKRKNDSSLNESADLPAEKKMKLSESDDSSAKNESQPNVEEFSGVKGEGVTTTKDDNDDVSKADGPTDGDGQKKKRRKKKKKKTDGGENKNADGKAEGKPKTFISDSRLLAYDINPKKFQRFQKYGKKRSENTNE